jgi:SOS-response transcriptional repressor LexA
MKLGERMKAQRERLELTMQQVGDTVGVSRATVSNWENGVHSPEVDKLPSIARRLQTTVGYLMGDTDVSEASNIAEPAASPYTVLRQVPLISYVQAGGWSSATDAYAMGGGMELLGVDFEVSRGTFALEILGDSMLPEFGEGDRIIVDPAVTPLPGDFVVAKNSAEEAMFKKYRPKGINERGEQVFELVPLNPDYPSRYSDREKITIIGVMVEHRRRRRR